MLNLCEEASIQSKKINRSELPSTGGYVVEKAYHRLDCGLGQGTGIISI